MKKQGLINSLFMIAIVSIILSSFYNFYTINQNIESIKGSHLDTKSLAIDLKKNAIAERMICDNPEFIDRGTYGDIPSWRCDYDRPCRLTYTEYFGNFKAEVCARDYKSDYEIGLNKTIEWDEEKKNDIDEIVSVINSPASELSYKPTSEEDYENTREYYMKECSEMNGDWKQLVYAQYCDFDDGKRWMEIEIWYDTIHGNNSEDLK